MKISQREIFLGVATLACVVIGGTWYGASGKVAEYKAMKGRIEQAKNEIQRQKSAIQMEAAWSTELAELEKGLRVFPMEQRSVSPDLMKTISDISSKHSLILQRNNPGNEQLTGNLYELGITITWQGSLEALVNVLADLQQQGIRYDVRSLNVQPMTGRNNAGLLSGNLMVNCAFTRKASS